MTSSQNKTRLIEFLTKFKVLNEFKIDCYKSHNNNITAFLNPLHGVKIDSDAIRNAMVMKDDIPSILWQLINAIWNEYYDTNDITQYEKKASISTNAHAT